MFGFSFTGTDSYPSFSVYTCPIETGNGKAPELAFYRCAGPAATPVPELICFAGARWAIEECFQTAKNEAGLDQYQVRDYRAGTRTSEVTPVRRPPRSVS